MITSHGTPTTSPGSLHRPELERDACGVGFVASFKGEKSHRILQYGLQSVCRVTHRGAVDADRKTGDGAGVLTQMPHKLFEGWLEEKGITLENGPEDLGVAMMFLPRRDVEQRKLAKKLAVEVARERGLTVLGWRTPPQNKDELGDKARLMRPSIRQLLFARPSGMDADAYERALYLTRKLIVRRCAEAGIAEEPVYIASCSHRTIVYKALCLPTALAKFYEDLENPDYQTGICLFHQRFSTNTFPTWPLAHPFSMLCHNGEINTVKGNRNWMRSRETDFESPLWGADVASLAPVCDPRESDSASLNAALELLVLSGRSPEQALALLVPPAYGIDPFTSAAEKAFYQFQESFAEPWDGPAAIVCSDGRTICAALDRNGLRPSRFKITRDGLIAAGSEVGLVALDDEDVIQKGRLAPGECMVVDTVGQAVRFNAEIKKELAARHPYGDWLAQNRVEFARLAGSGIPAPAEALDILGLSQKQAAFGYTDEELNMVFTPMIKDGMEGTYSMGDDAALSVLSLQPRVLYTYFKQLFAQVTNPPIDPIRERLVMSLGVALGWYRNFLAETPEHARVVWLDSPFLFDHELEKLRGLGADFPSRTLDATWPVDQGPAGLEAAVHRLCAEADQAVDDGIRILILSDRAVDHDRVPVPALLATGAVHHDLVRRAKRLRLSIVVDTGEARDVHQVSCLFGYGAQAVCPYLGAETVRELLQKDVDGKVFGGKALAEALGKYRSALEKGVLKIMSKMGISCLQSYQGAQIFEAVGLSSELTDFAFAGTPCQIEGIGYLQIAAESLTRHQAGFAAAVPQEIKLGDPGYFRFRREGEKHALHGQTIKNFHTFVRDNDPARYQAYVDEIKSVQPIALHDLFEFNPAKLGTPIPLDEVEPIESIRVRFTTAAMSLGAISPEAHEALAEAMNEIGGKSNSGEGGEDPVRFKHRPDGSWLNSKIKQVASGRFGVTAEYLASAEEIEIKMAQGAKPGEGGQLPGHKVNALIARLRRTQPGVQLISPPPHHDIYSIEDLAQLIHDLKEVNPRARICVKLVAETGVGTIAAGVAKANADIILISGHEGGTGASPISSIKHAGLPWELGLAETQQVLMLNDLRSRVTLRTDGGLRTGLDIVHAAILGAEEYNFGTIALIALGCVYVRQCHLNTCPVGVATQREDLRAKFKGKKEHVINFFNAVAEEVRHHLASLGVRRLEDIIGRPEYLRQRTVPNHPKANSLDLSRLLHDVAREKDLDLPRFCLENRNDGLHDHPLDDKIIQRAKDAIRDKMPIRLAFNVQNTHRNIGTKLSGEVAFLHGDHGLPEGTITLDLQGSAGQSFGTFLCGGITLRLTGEANDYVGKGMTGGVIVVRPPAKTGFVPSENSILGNTCLYGASGGHLFANGRAGERFAVRNSGVTAVVEGVGDHGCEYMTNGLVVILGPTGKNFGAGMSGGVAYVLDEAGHFPKLANLEMIELVPVEEAADIALLKELTYNHLDATDSAKARALLADWPAAQARFWKVRPKTVNPPGPAAKPQAVAAKV
jgi:glutamate synthase (NADPH/NADH) large chain/glutamate synthase (ferredoxin)